jgi:hypothetical protein
MTVAPERSLVLTEVVWDPTGCRVRVRVDDGPATLVDAVGLALNYRLDAEPERQCIGSRSPKRNSGSYRDCRNRPQPGERVCVTCAVTNAEFAADLHHAHTRDRASIDRAVLDHLQQPNHLYLAAFRDGSLKVGTSTARRIATRLTEQGAWQAVEVASVEDGFAVRRLEDLVTDKLGLPQSVAMSRKLAGMASPMGEDELSDRLRTAVGDVHLLLDSLDRLPGGKEVPPSKRERWWRFVDSDAVSADGVEVGAGVSEPWAGLHRYPARLDRGAHRIDVLAMCGRMAVLGRSGSDDRFVADLGRLFGLELRIGDHVPDELVIQDSLF